ATATTSTSCWTPSGSTTRHAPPDRLGPPAPPLQASPATPPPPRTHLQEGADTVGTTTPTQPNNAPAAAEAGAGPRLAQMIRTLITTTANQPSRSVQRRIGPSEVGNPCTRALAYKLHDWPETPGDRDPWASVQGTAVHAWMADLFE